jgi:glycosyltransferase involved in cell wall biosynthesis
MKIFIALNHSPLFGGGVEQVVRKIVDNSSAKFKAKLTLICNDPSQKEKFSYNDVPCINLITKRSHLFDRLILRSQRSYSRLIKGYADQHLTEGDTLNIQGVEYAAAFAGKKSAYKVVATSHGSLFQQISEVGVRLAPPRMLLTKIFLYFWRWYYYFVEKQALSGVSQLICINKTILEFYRSQFSYTRPSTVIYNGLDIPNQLVKSKPKTDEQFRCVVVGSEPYLKGLDIAIGLADRINTVLGKSLELVVVGFSGAKDSILDQAKTRPYLNYIGRVSPDEVQRYYQETDFLLMPSRYEGFPLTILEAIGCGKPVLVSLVCKTYELPKHEQFSLIVSSHDLDEWITATLEIMQRERYNALREGAENFDAQPFSWKAIATQYEKTL